MADTNTDHTHGFLTGITGVIPFVGEKETLVRAVEKGKKK